MGWPWTWIVSSRPWRVIFSARAEVGVSVRGDVEHCRALRDRPREFVDPPPLVDGNDLIEHGVPPGPEFRRLLQAVRDAQLDGELATREEALCRVDRLREVGEG